jgi:hypothetical protein
VAAPAGTALGASRSHGSKEVCSASQCVAFKSLVLSRASASIPTQLCYRNLLYQLSPKRLMSSESDPNRFVSFALSLSVRASLSSSSDDDEPNKSDSVACGSTGLVCFFLLWPRLCLLLTCAREGRPSGTTSRASSGCGCGCGSGSGSSSGSGSDSGFDSGSTALARPPASYAAFASFWARLHAL